MPLVKRRALKILNELDAAQSELLGKAVVLADGKAGTVENVWLDELHGLRIAIKVMMEDGRSQQSSFGNDGPQATGNCDAIGGITHWRAVADPLCTLRDPGG